MFILGRGLIAHNALQPMDRARLTQAPKQSVGAVIIIITVDEKGLDARPATTGDEGRKAWDERHSLGRANRAQRNLSEQPETAFRG